LLLNFRYPAKIFFTYRVNKTPKPLQKRIAVGYQHGVDI